MSKLFRGIVTSWPVVGAIVVCGGAVAAAGCQSVIGIHDVSLEGSVGGSTSSSTASRTTSGGGSTTRSSSTASSSGTGGQSTAAASFGFAITDTSVNVPYGGHNYVNVEIIPSGGFSGAVDVIVQGGPTGLTSTPLTIPAGATTGKLQVGAGTTLVLGTTFTLTLAATAGSITKTTTVSAVVTGKPGDFDTTFNSGIVGGPTVNGAVYLTDILELSTGNILVSGLSVDNHGGTAGVAARFLPGGTLDTTFNTTGLLSQSYGHGQGTGFASLARALDGTLRFYGSNNAYVGTSYTPYNIYLFHYTVAGALSPITSDTGIDAIALGTGNETVTAGMLVPNNTDSVVTGSKDGSLFVARINDRYSDFNSTFGTPNGFVAPALGGTASSGEALTFDPTGHIVVAGWVTNATTGDDVVLLRMSGTDGTLDTSFGKGGVVTLARPGNQHGSAVIVQADGTILVAAATTEGSAPQLLVQRFLASGAPDTTFGTEGAVLAPLGTNSNGGDPAGRTAWLATMLDGRIIVGGNGTVGGTTGAVLARFLPNGSPDPTYGTNGELAVFVGMYGILGAMTLANDGKLLLAGGNSPNPPGASFVARVWN